MTSLSGFTLLEAQPPLPGGTMRLWEIMDVKYGEETGWELLIEMEGDGQSIRITFPNFISFRAQDEGQMLEYWPLREREGVAVGTIYLIESSPYKDEFQATSVAGFISPLAHYLIAGNNLCVEVLATSNEAPNISGNQLTS